MKLESVSHVNITIPLFALYLITYIKERKKFIYLFVLNMGFIELPGPEINVLFSGHCVY